MKNGREKATIKNIAKAAGFSVSTVSRVMSGSDYPVSGEVRDSIIRIAEELNYTPNLHARALKTNASMELAAVVPSITNPFYTSLISGIESAAAKRGYNVLLYNTGFQEDLEKKIIKNAISKGIDGIILSTGTITPSLLAPLAAAGIKTYLVDYMISGRNFGSIYFDYRRGSLLETDYLIKKGHERIAFLSLPLVNKSRQDRLAGFKDALNQAGLKLSEEAVFLYDHKETVLENTEFMAGYELARRAVNSDFKPTALMAFNDMAAFGVLHYLHTNRITVPRDISVVGFDDTTFAEISLPPLTTVRVPALQMGEMAVRLLIEEIREKKDTPVSLTMEPQIIERASVRDIGK